jgi:dTMP kinase
MAKLMLSGAERSIIDIFDPGKSEYQLPETLPVDFIVDNRLCFSLYNKVGSELESKYNSEDLERIRRKAKSMEFSVNEVRNIAKVFEENGINCAFVYKGITSQCDSSDVDVVIEKEQDKETRNLLEKLGYVHITTWGGGNVYVKSEAGNAVQIELGYEELSPYKYPFTKGIKIMSNKRELKGINIPSSSDELVELTFKLIIGRRPIRLSDIIHLSNLLKGCDVDYIRTNIKNGLFVPFLHFVYIINTIHKKLYNKDIESPLIGIADELHNQSKILKLISGIETRKLRLPFHSRILTNSCMGYKLIYDLTHLKFKDFIEDLQRFLYPVTTNYLLFAKMVLTTKGIVVCFSGIDGTGKTTHATKLVERFKNMAIPCQYARCIFEPKISYPFMALFYLVTGGYRRKDYWKSRILRRIWNYIVIFDFLYIYFTQVKIPLLMSKSVICDRYVYDLIVSLRYNGLYSERASKILLKIIPKPDLVFMLDIPEDVSNLRKDDTKDAVNIKDLDNATAYLSFHRKSFLEIAESLNIPVIDATKDLKELNEDFYKQAIQTYINKQKEYNESL